MQSRCEASGERCACLFTTVLACINAFTIIYGISLMCECVRVFVCLWLCMFCQVWWCTACVCVGVCVCVCVCEALSNEHATITNMHVHATHTTYAFRKHIYHFQDILLLATELLKQMRPQPMKPVAYMETWTFSSNPNMSHPYGGSTSIKLHATLIPNR